MKKLITSLLIALSFTASFSCYGADSQDNGLGQHFDPLLIHSYSGRNLIPLPHLPTREEKAAQQYGMSGQELAGQPGGREKRQRESQEEQPRKKRTLTVPLPPLERRGDQRTLSDAEFNQLLNQALSASDSSTSYTPHEAGQAPLEQLPLELLERIRQAIPPHLRGRLALTSESLRGYTQSTIKHLTIPVTDITEQNVQDAAKKFPKVTSLTITKSATETAITPGQIALLARAFPLITSLDLTKTGLTAAGAEALSQDGVFTNLKKLTLENNYTLLDEGVKALAAASFAHALESLNLAQTDITAAGVQIVSQPAIFVSLTSLNIRRAAHDSADAHASILALSQAPFAHKLESLDVSNMSLNDQALEVLAKPGVFVGLKSLNLAQNFKVTDTGITALLAAPFIHQLESLNLGWLTRISSASLKALFKPGVLVSLKSLSLASPIGILRHASDVSALANAPFVHMLESLDLLGSGITDQALTLLCKPGKFTSLKSLNLSSNSSIGDAGIGALLAAPFVHTLESLSLAETGITNQALASLSQPGKFVSLKSLDVSRNSKISDGGIAYLLHAPFAGHLETLNLTGIKLTDMTKRIVQASDIAKNIIF